VDASQDIGNPGTRALKKSTRLNKRIVPNFFFLGKGGNRNCLEIKKAREQFESKKGGVMEIKERTRGS
jgi:hypothetical protein